MRNHRNILLAMSWYYPTVHRGIVNYARDHPWPSGVICRRSTDALAVDHPGVREALRFMHDNFQLPIGVMDLARTAGMSRSGLEKAFREHFVRSPGQELRRVRVEHAKRELRESNASLPIVAQATGFRSSQQLCKTFRDQVGVTPNQYRLATAAEPEVAVSTAK